ncbi:effector-associated constant component EACC1 [Streptomyces sp. NPDC055013]
MSDIRLSLSVEGDDSDQGLAALYQWLGSEPELRGLVKGSGTPRPGELGSLTDALIVAVGGGGALSVLAASLKAFLALPRRSDVRIVVRGTADGRTVEIDAKRVDDVEELVRQALNAPREELHTDNDAG